MHHYLTLWIPCPHDPGHINTQIQCNMHNMHIQSFIYMQKKNLLYHTEHKDTISDNAPVLKKRTGAALMSSVMILPETLFICFVDAAYFSFFLQSLYVYYFIMLLIYSI